MDRIERLPRPTALRLRSSVVVSSIPQVVNELAQNALDAGATHIECWVDLSRGNESIRVEDDGHGLDQNALQAVGERNMTSKDTHGFGAMNTYGFRGEALASISTMALVDITSRSQGEDTFTKILKKGTSLYLGPARRDLGRAHGTNVTVRDLFNGVPVRRAELEQASAYSIITGCKKVIESLALAHPHVRWLLRSNGSRGGRKVLSLQGCNSTLEVFRSLYGIAGVEKVQGVHVSAGPRHLDGFISLEGSVTRAHQHLFINGYPIENTPLHQIISKRFAKSSFSTMASDLMDDEPRGGKRPSPRRLERYPVYVLNLTLPAEEVDAAYEPQKTTLGLKDSGTVEAFLLAVVEEFLSRNSFVSARRSTTPMSPTPQSVAERSTRSRKRGRQRSSSPTLNRNVRRSVSRAPEESLNRLYEERIKPIEAALRPEVSEEPRKQEGNDSGSNAVRDLITDIDEGVLRITRAASAASDLGGSGDPTILTKTLPGPEVDVALTATALEHAVVLQQVDRKFIPCVLQGDGRRTLAIFDQHAADERASLESILDTLCRSFADNCMITTTLEEGSVRLVLSRQDVEHLGTPGVRELLERWGIKLGPVLQSGEYSQIDVHAVPELLDRLARKQGTELTRLLRLYLPEAAEGIGEAEALIASFDKETSTGEGRKSWSSVLRWMPREMLELAKSKACRGAVMFEDKLDQDQCERLIARLADTRNPWVCAHGRPTIVPLCVVDGEETGQRQIDWASFSVD